MFVELRHIQGTRQVQLVIPAIDPAAAYEPEIAAGINIMYGVHMYDVIVYMCCTYTCTAHNMTLLLLLNATVKSRRSQANCIIDMVI